MNNGSVQLSNIALWRQTGADILVHSRTAAGHSHGNEAESTMPVQNLGLQNLSTERGRMDDEYEALLGGAGSMTKIRSKIEAISNTEEREAAANAWKESMSRPIKLIEARYSRLEFSEKPVKIQEPATQEGRKNLRG